MRVAINIWIARIVPILLAVVVGYATHVLVAQLSGMLYCQTATHYYAHTNLVKHLITKEDARGTATFILVTYFAILMLMITSFGRLVFITYFEPPYVRLGPSPSKEKHDTISAGQYYSGKEDIDSPGLELFYTKDTFIAESTGNPRWCFPCGNWKPDRAHHCQSSGRCIRKMDHFCPWVGGPIGENNFKFFVQFTSYSTLYCLHLLVVMNTYVFGVQKPKGEHLEVQFIIIIVLAALFLLFSGAMSLNSIQLATRNLTQVERIGLKKKTYFLAVLVPLWKSLNHIASPVGLFRDFFSITYPLGTNDHYLKLNRVTPTSPAAIHPRQHKNSSSNQILTDSNENHPRFHPKNLSDFELSSSNSDEKLWKTDVEDLPFEEPNYTLNMNQMELPENPMQEMEKDEESLSLHKSQSDRDTMAFRTFVIIQTNEGENPWDLGTRALNWKTVMGDNLLDWLLPVRRSPCCNHENQEGQFQFGSVVDSIRSKLEFLDPGHVPSHDGWENRQPCEKIASNNSQDNSNVK